MQNKQVSDAFLCLKNKPGNFLAGKISYYYESWKTLTKDRYILDIVRNGYQIEFVTEPCEECNRIPINFNIKDRKSFLNYLKSLKTKE